MVPYFLFLFVLTSTNAFFLEEECLNYTVYPVQYDLTIIPYIYVGNSYYECEVKITVIANSPNVRMIELDAKDLDINDETIKVLYGEKDIINKHRPFEYDKVAGKFFIYLREPLLQYSVFKAQYVIKMHFRKSVKSDSTGIFVVPYEDHGTKHIYVTRLSPHKAKYFFPCFDNPRFEAVFKFKVYLVPSRNGIQYANTSLVIAKEMTRHDLQENYKIIEYVPSPQVALHQVGFHYSQFASRQVSARRTNDTIVVWAIPTKLHQLDYILNFGQRMLNLIIEYAQVNRPLVYGPINIVAVPEKLDGYEVGSWNLLTNGENRLVYHSEFTSIGQEERMTFELAQQLCRIWLGNPGELQRTRWYEEWFKEGVATYLASYFLTQYQQGVHSLRQRVPINRYGLEMKHKAMTEDWHHSTPALITFNRTLAVEIPPRYKELVQYKTASLLWMVENWIGSDKFHMALVKYINTRRGQYVSLRDFMTNLDLDTVECLHQFFNGSTSSKVLYSWFHHPGYPVIHVNVLRDRTPNAIQLKQHKFSFTQEDRDTHYLIPISYLVQNNLNCYNCYQPRFTIDQTYTFEENLNGGWIILNTNASGYYRVNYDQHTWKLITKTLRENRLAINEMNRAQIVNDAFALYAAGIIDQSLAVEILNYLELETSSVVWNAAISGFELIKTPGASCSMTKFLYEDWQEFMRNKIAPIFSQVAGEIEQHHDNRIFRSKIVSFACDLEHKPCLDYVRFQYEHYRRSQRLDPDIRETCYRVQYYESDEPFVRQGFNEFEVEDKLRAEHRIREEKRFLHGVPKGSLVMDRLVMSSTEEPTSKLVTVDGTPGSTVAGTKDAAVTSTVSSTVIVIFAYLSLTVAR